MYRALIVEDEDLMREYLTEHLNRFAEEWIAAGSARNGAEAIEMIRKERFDGIITDIRMPAMDGLSMAKAIRETDPRIPILILSGYNEFDYARAAVRLNIFDYLLKPIDETELSMALSAMTNLLSRPVADGDEGEKNVDLENMPALGLAQQALAFVRDHYAEPLSLTMVAEELHVSPAYLSTVFHREIGASYSRTLLKYRMEAAARQLSGTGLQVQQIAQNVGFVSAKHFTHVFRTYYGLSPMEYRREYEAGKG